MTAKKDPDQAVFPSVTFASHMPFFDGKSLLFCQAGPPLEHTFRSEGTIWDRIEKVPRLRAHFKNLKRTHKGAFRRWKLAVADWGSRKVRPLPTGLPATAVECSPSYYLDGGTYHLSFIGGIPTSRSIEYRLYQMWGPSLDKTGPAVAADVGSTKAGFIGRQYLCTVDGSSLHIQDRHAGTKFRLLVPFKRIVRVTYRQDDEQTLIITGTTADDLISTLLYNIATDDAFSIDAVEHVYKPSVYGQQIVFASRLGGRRDDCELRLGTLALTKSNVSMTRVNQP